MKLKSIITVLLAGSVLLSTQQTSMVVKAAVEETVISNTVTQEDQATENVKAISSVTTSAVEMDAEQVKADQSDVDGNVIASGTAIVQEQVAVAPVVQTEEQDVTVNSETTQSQTTGAKVISQKKTSTKRAAKKTYSSTDLKLLSCIIYAEASGEPYAGKKAVGIVVMNRKASKSFPNTVKGVIYQKFQFGPVRNGALKRAMSRYQAGKFKSASEKACIKAAREVLAGDKKVSYNGKVYDLKTFHFFSTKVKHARLRIAHHQFK